MRLLDLPLPLRIESALWSFVSERLQNIHNQNIKIKQTKNLQKTIVFKIYMKNKTQKEKKNGKKKTKL